MVQHMTSFAVVAGVQVRRQVLRARLDQLSNARNRQLAAPPAGAGAIEHVDDVGRAAEEAVVT